MITIELIVALIKASIFYKCYSHWETHVTGWYWLSVFIITIIMHYNFSMSLLLTVCHVPLFICSCANLSSNTLMLLCLTRGGDTPNYPDHSPGGDWGWYRVRVTWYWHRYWHRYKRSVFHLYIALTDEVLLFTRDTYISLLICVLYYTVGVSNPPPRRPPSCRV